MSTPDWSEPGGPTSHLPLLLSELESRQGVDIFSFTYGNRMFWKLPKSFCRSLAGRVLITFFDLGFFLSMCIRHGPPDVLHLNSAYEKFALVRDLPYLMCASFFGSRKLIKTHGSDERLLAPKSMLFKKLQEFHFKLCDIVTFLSMEEMIQFQNRFPLFKEKFHTAKNIVIPLELQDLNEDNHEILFGGRFVPKKNIPSLIKAFSSIAKSFLNARLIMAGSGPLEKELRKRAAEYNLSEQVSWEGWVDRTRLRYLTQRCRVVVFTSTDSEGMPMMLLEALNSSSIIVTTSVRWTRSYPIQDLGVIEVDGYCATKITLALERALNAPFITEEIILLRKVFLAQFSQKRVADEFLDFYRR